MTAEDKHKSDIPSVAVTPYKGMHTNLPA